MFGIILLKIICEKKVAIKMKCPNCGAETSESICEFCKSEMPREKTDINITNNYYENVSQHDINNGRCPKCGSNKITFKREKITAATKRSSEKRLIVRGRKGRSISHFAYMTTGLCQNCGYTWNPNIDLEERKTNRWLWVLGWIFIFPVPLTLVLLRNEKMKKNLKYGIIAAAWIIYLIAVLCSGRSNTDKTHSQIEKTKQELQQETIKPSNEAESAEKNKENIDACIDGIIMKYNSLASEKLVFVENFTPSDNNSGHYRTEFRLGAYINAVGKSYLLGDKTVDVVASERINFRVYTKDVSFAQVIDLIKGMSPLIDETLSASDLVETLNEVETKKDVNGWYYGKLGMTLSGNDDKGYELMIKKD